MITYVSLLRGINVGGHKQIRMDELRAVYAAAGLSQVKSYLQSGNVVFDSPEKNRASLTATLEAAITTAFGHAVTVILRDAAEMQRVFTNNPFLTTRAEDTAKLHVVFLAAPPSAADVETLVVPDREVDELIVAGQEVYLFCPNGTGRSKLTNAFFEKKLRTTATARNWNTVSALYQLTYPD